MNDVEGILCSQKLCLAAENIAKRSQYSTCSEDMNLVMALITLF